MDSQLRQLLGMLNTFSWKHEVLEAKVEQLILAACIMTFIIVVGATAMLSYVVKTCARGSKKEKGGSVSSTFGNSMRQTVIAAESRNDVPVINFHQPKNENGANNTNSQKQEPNRFDI